MKPIKGKIYKISYKGPFFYNDYFGTAVCNGKIEKNTNPDGSTEDWYGFDIPNDYDTWFSEEDIVEEIV